MRYRTERFILEPFTKEFINENYLSWFHDPEITKYNSHGVFPHQKQDCENFLSDIVNNKILVWAVIVKEKHIGNISLQSINWINRSAEFVVLIGKSDYWGQGITTEAGKIILKHGFEILGMNRIWTGTASINIGMQKVAKKMEMVQEGRFREGVFLHGKFEDVFLYSILRDKWKMK